MQKRSIRWHLIYPHLKQHKFRIFISVASISASTAASVYFPRALGSFVDSLKHGQSTNSDLNAEEQLKLNNNNNNRSMYKSLSVLAGIFSVVGIATYARTSAMHIVSQDIARKMRYKIYRNILVHRPVSYFSKPGVSSATLTSRLTQDVEFMSDFISKNSMTTVRALGEGIGGLSFLYVLSSHLTSTVFFQTWIPVMVGIAFIYSRRMKTVNSKYLEALSSQAKFASERIANMKTVVYPFGKNINEVTKYEQDHLKPLIKYGKKLGIANGIFEGLVYTGTHLSILAMVIMGTWSVIDGSCAFTIGDLSALLLYSVYVVQSFGTLSSMYPKLVKFSSVTDRIVELLLESDVISKQVASTEGSLALAHVQQQQQLQQLKPLLNHGTIEFSNVSFSYPERPLVKSLTNYSLKINSGEVVALMGPSGVGKSTLALLLSRFYSVNSGSISIGGYDIYQIDPYHLRRNCIALVQQDPIIFHGSILDNIVFSAGHSTLALQTSHSIDMDLVCKFSKMVELHDFITNDLSDGYHTILTGERGVQLSGGQKQKLNLCRSLYHYHCHYRQPYTVERDSLSRSTLCKIYILDECTSALDAHTEHIILQRVIEYLRQREATCVIITHHLSDHLRPYIDRVVSWA